MSRFQVQIPDAAQRNVDLILHQIMRSTVPLLRADRNRLELEGCGILLTVADSAFVLTALHVLRPLLRDNIPMCMGAGSEDSPGVLISNQGVLKADDPIDIALIELRTEQSEEIARSNAYVHSGRCLVRRSYGPANLFFVCGIPAQDTLPMLSRRLLHMAAFGFITGQFPADSLQSDCPEYQPDAHLILDYTESNRRDEFGLPIPLPDPRGMSGCGVWLLPALGTTSVENWAFDQLKLVAIAQAYHTRERFMIATRFDSALRLLYRFRPDLRGSLRVSFPEVE